MHEMSICIYTYTYKHICLCKTSVLTLSSTDVVAQLKSSKDSLASPLRDEHAPMRSSREIAVTQTQTHSVLDSCPWSGVRDFDRRSRTLICDVQAWRKTFGNVLAGDLLAVISEYDVSRVPQLCERPLLPFVREHVEETCKSASETRLPFDAKKLMDKASGVERTFIERLQHDCNALSDMEKKRMR
jgi:hypothetical protein